MKKRKKQEGSQKRKKKVAITSGQGPKVQVDVAIASDNGDSGNDEANPEQEDDKSGKKDDNENSEEDGSQKSDESEEKEELEESEESEDEEYSAESEESEEEDEEETMTAEKYFTVTAFDNYHHEWLVGFYNYLSRPSAGFLRLFASAIKENDRKLYITSHRLRNFLGHVLLGRCHAQSPLK